MYISISTKWKLTNHHENHSLVSIISAQAAFMCKCSKDEIFRTWEHEMQNPFDGKVVQKKGNSFPFPGAVSLSSKQTCLER